jgi:ankyrin repeat protein
MHTARLFQNFRPIACQKFYNFKTTIFDRKIKCCFLFKRSWTFLLESGASANKKYYMGYEINLVPMRHLQCFELLLQYGANPNVFSWCRMTPLMKACKENRIDVVRLLLRFGADVHAKCPARIHQEH